MQEVPCIEIPLTQNQIAIVDVADLHLLVPHKWHVGSHGYAIYTAASSGNKVLMHRVIVGADLHEQVDHINGNKLDNRHCNLRVCSRSENLYNQKHRIDNTSGYRGVSWCNSQKRWRAYVNAAGRRIELGYFSSQDEAVRRRVEAAQELHGEFFVPATGRT